MGVEVDGEAVGLEDPLPPQPARPKVADTVNETTQDFRLR